MLKEQLKSGIKNLALGLVLSAVAITFFGCGDVEQTSGELTQSGAKTQNAQEQKITISCAGDCTLGTDAAFGGVTDENGALDRPKLAKIVFSDPEKLAELNRITTPYIRAASLAAIRAQSACPVVLYDAPTLFEAGADDFCDAVIAVLAPHDTRVSRIIERDHLPEEAARARIDAQPPDSFYRAKCGYIIENNGDLDTLYRDTDALYQILMK